MAKKRPEFSFPELDHRGRNAILRSTAEVEAEEALLAQADVVAGSPPATPEAPSARPLPAESQTEPSAATGASSVPAPMRARTRPPKPAAGSALIDQLKQKLRAKQHLSSYTFRFRAEELELLDRLVGELNQTRTSKLSKNDLVRLALAWLLTDYEEYGQASLVVEVTRQE